MLNTYMKAVGQGVQVFLLNSQTDGQTDRRKTDRRTDKQTDNYSERPELHFSTRFTCLKDLKHGFVKSTRITARVQACADLLAELLASVFPCGTSQVYV